jgi:hypothetical protein
MLHERGASSLSQTIPVTSHDGSQQLAIGRLALIILCAMPNTDHWHSNLVIFTRPLSERNGDRSIPDRISPALQPFIQSVILAPPIKEERVKMSDELANMRTLAKDCPDRVRPRIVAKLLSLDTVGCDTAWGQMEVIPLVSHEHPSFKRLGYLAIAHMFDETNECIGLITATVQKDLAHPNGAV